MAQPYVPSLVLPHPLPLQIRQFRPFATLVSQSHFAWSVNVIRAGQCGLSHRAFPTSYPSVHRKVGQGLAKHSRFRTHLFPLLSSPQTGSPPHHSPYPAVPFAPRPSVSASNLWSRARFLRYAQSLRPRTQRRPTLLGSGKQSQSDYYYCVCLSFTLSTFTPLLFIVRTLSRIDISLFQPLQIRLAACLLAIGRELHTAQLCQSPCAGSLTSDYRRLDPFVCLCTRALENGTRTSPRSWE